MPKYPAPAPPFIPARWHGGKQTPKAIVIHGTVSPCAKGGARAVARFFATEGTPTSAHYVVDPGETIQCVGDHVVAYHCGYNTGSLAVELCDPQTGDPGRWGDADHKAMLKRAARLVAELCLAYGIETRKVRVSELKAKGPHGIYGHNDSRLAFGHTTHTDPGEGFPWSSFMRMVRAEVASIKASKKPVRKPAPKPVPSRPEPSTTTLQVVDWNVERDRKEADVLHDLEHIIAAEKPDVMTLQEIAGYRKVLEQVAQDHGFHVVAYHDQREQDETAILVRDGHHLRALASVKVTQKGWFTVRGHMTPPKWVTACIVEDIGFASVHTPPTVQTYKLRHASPLRWRAYQQLMGNMPRVLAHLGPAAVVCGDWNVDKNSDTGMAGWPLATFKALGLGRHAPQDGTHGRRIIDYCFAKGVEVGHRRVLPKLGSDHRAVSFTVTL